MRIKLKGLTRCAACLAPACVLVLLGIVASGPPRAATAAIILSCVMMMLGIAHLVVWGKGAFGAPLGVKRWLYTLLALGPLFLLYTALDFEVADFAPPLFGMFAVFQVSDSTRAWAFRMGGHSGTALLPVHNSALRRELRSVLGASLLLLIALVTFWRAYSPWGGRASGQAIVPITLAAALFGSLDVYVLVRVRGLARAAARLQAPGASDRGAGNLGRSRPAVTYVLLWAACLTGTALLWTFGDRHAFFSRPQLSAAHAYAVVLIFSAMLRRVRRELRSLREASAGSGADRGAALS